MKKLILSTLVLTALLLPMTSGVMAEEEPSSLIPPAVELFDPGPAEAFRPGSVPADSSLTDAIRLPVTALAQTMLETGLSYESANDTFVWNTLYYALSIFGQLDDRAQLTDQALLFPSETAQDYLRALFRDRTLLPPVPVPLQDAVRYDPLTDLYCLSLGDLGLTQLSLSAPTPAQDGLVMVEGTLTSPDADEPLCTIRVLLEANDSMFGFSIVNAKLD